MFNGFISEKTPLNFEFSSTHLFSTLYKYVFTRKNTPNSTWTILTSIVFLTLKTTFGSLSLSLLSIICFLIRPMNEYWKITNLTTGLTKFKILLLLTLYICFWINKWRHLVILGQVLNRSRLILMKFFRAFNL